MVINTFSIETVSVTPVFTPYFNYRGVSVLLAICQFCERIFHMLVKDRPTKNNRCLVFSGCPFSMGLYKRNKDGVGRDYFNVPISMGCWFSVVPVLIIFTVSRE